MPNKTYKMAASYQDVISTLNKKAFGSEILDHKFRLDVEKSIWNLDISITTLPDDNFLALVKALNTNLYLNGQHFYHRLYTPDTTARRFKREITLRFCPIKVANAEYIANLCKIKTTVKLTLDFTAGLMIHVDHIAVLTRSLSEYSICFPDFPRSTTTSSLLESSTEISSEEGYVGPAL